MGAQIERFWYAADCLVKLGVPWYISFVFPHWIEEIIEYGNYIESKFIAKLISSHHEIILFDITLQDDIARG